MDPSRNTAAVYDRYVKQYMARFMDLELYKDTFQDILNLLPEGARVLELGCGPGNVIRYLRSQRKDLHFLGIDLAPGMIQAARQANPGVEFKLMDIREAGRMDGTFDAVLAPFCLPYISTDDLEALFANMGKLSVENGILYLSFMEGARERSGYEKTSFTGETEIHVNYYPETEIGKLLDHYGFKVQKKYSKDYLELDGTVTTDLFYLARKQ